MMRSLPLPLAALGLFVALAPPAIQEARAVEPWNSPCLMDLRQIKEDWTRISTPATRDAIAKEVTRAEQSYRKGREQECQDRVTRIKDMMK